jgi:hypothetical protein
VVRNYGGAAPGQPLPALYSRLIPGQAAPSVDPADPWRPDLIVIGLGTNDFSTPVAPGEAWADEAALHADYRRAYAGFIRDLAQRHPQARFLLIAGDSFAADVEQVANTVDAETPGLATPVRITGMDLGLATGTRHRRPADDGGSAGDGGAGGSSLKNPLPWGEGPHKRYRRFPRRTPFGNPPRGLIAGLPRMPSLGRGAFGSTGSASVSISNSSPPVTGVASRSLTSTARPSGKRLPVRSPTRACMRSSWTKYSSPRVETGTRPSAPVSSSFTNRPKRVTPVIRP